MGFGFLIAMKVANFVIKKRIVSGFTKELMENGSKVPFKCRLCGYDLQHGEGD